MSQEKVNWIKDEAKLNPTVSQEKLSDIYDDYVAGSNIVSHTPTFETTKVNPDGIPLESHGKQTGYDTNSVSADKAVDKMASTMMSPGENAKKSWIEDEAKLNPTVSQEKLRAIYDDYMSSPDRQEVSQRDQLIARHKAMQHFYAGLEHNEDTDPDNTKSGFDASDKMSMLGSAILGLGSGALKSFIGIGDLALKLPDHYGLLPKGYEVPTLKEKQDRFFKQNKLLQRAYLSHQTVNNISNFIGSLAPYFIPSAGSGEAATAVGGKIESMLDSIKNLPELAKKITITDNMTEKLVDAATKNGTEKFIHKIIPLFRFIQKILPVVRHGSEGALYGAASYDPQANTEMKNAMIGAISSLGLVGGGKLIQGLSSKLIPKIEEVARNYGITLPVMPKLNAFLESMPILGNGVRVAENQKEYIDNIAKQIANKIAPLQENEAASRVQYSKFLHGELKKGFEDNKKLASKNIMKLNNAIEELDPNDLVDMSGVRDAAKDLLSSEDIKIKAFQNDDLKNVLKDIVDSPDMSYKDLKENRSALGEEKGAAVGREGRAYDILYSKMSEAMENHSGKISNLQKTADKFYSEKVVPFLYGKWKKYIHPDYNSDNFIKDFLKPDNPSNIQDLLKSLPKNEASITAARAAIVHSALDHAQLATGEINPEKFIKNFKALGDSNNILFTDEQRSMVDGYGKLLQLTRKLAPQWLDKTNSNSISRVLHHGMVGHGIGTAGGLYLAISHPFIGLPLISSSLGFTRLMTSNVGRKLLVKISKFSGKFDGKNVPDFIPRAIRIATSTSLPTSLPQGL